MCYSNYVPYFINAVTLKTGLRGPWRSLKMPPFNREPMTSYWCCIVRWRCALHPKGAVRPPSQVPQCPQKFWDLLHMPTQHDKQEPNFERWSNGDGNANLTDWLIKLDGRKILRVDHAPSCRGQIFLWHKCWCAICLRQLTLLLQTRLPFQSPLSTSCWPSCHCQCAEWKKFLDSSSPDSGSRLHTC